MLQITRTVLREDALSKGYLSGTRGVDWRNYFGEIASQIVSGELRIPSKVDK